MTDVFIPTTIKDFNKLGVIIQSIIKFTKDPIGDIYVSMPDVQCLAKQYEVNGGDGVIHQVKMYNDLDVLPAADIHMAKFRPNWVLQQLLKLCQSLTKSEYVFICDSDIVLIRDFHLFESGKPVQYLGCDDNEYYMNFNRKFSHNEFGRVSSCSYIADIGVWKKSIIEEMFARYGMTTSEFIDFTFKNVHYDGTQSGSCIISEYELYGNYCEKFHPDMYVKKPFSKLECTRAQMSQRQQAFTKDDIIHIVSSADVSAYDAVKLQSSCLPSDLSYHKTTMR